jgi:hypothetical protein
LVKVENVSKIFCCDLKKSLLYGLQDSARDLMSWGKRGTEERSQESGVRKKRPTTALARRLFLIQNPKFKIQNSPDPFGQVSSSR